MKFPFFNFLLLTIFITGCSSISYKPTLQKTPIKINDQTDSISSKQAPAVTEIQNFVAQPVNHFKLSNDLTVLHFQTEQQITATTLIGLFLHNPEPYNPINLKLNANWNLLNINDNDYRISTLAANFGAEMQTVSDSIATGWYFEVLQKDQQNAFLLLSKILNNRSYHSKELLQQKQKYTLQQQLRSVNGLSLSQQLYKNLVFSKQSSVSKISKSSSRKKLLKKITEDDLKHYFINNFQANNMVLVILSETSVERLKPIIESTFIQFPTPTSEELNNPTSNKNLATKSATQLRQQRDSDIIYAINRPHSTQVDIRISFTPIIVDNIEYQSLKLFADILAGRSLNSRMQSDLRERQGLSYSISHQLSQVSDFHSLHFLASTENHKLPALLDGMQQHINFLLQNALNENEFNFIKQRRLVNLQRSRLHPYRKMSFMLQNFTNQNPLDKISHEAQELSKLSYKDFLSFVKRLKREPRLNILSGDKPAIRHHMCKLQSCTMQWFNKNLVPQK